jgi:hypothetical protein
MDRSLVIRSALDSGKLELSPVEDRDELEYCIAHLVVGSLAARVRFYSYETRELGLGEFFTDLAKHWRGWDGEKTWESLEGDLVLSASHDGLGHVKLTVELRDRFRDIEYGWLARAALLLEAGSLDEVARSATRFPKTGRGR